MHELQPLLVLRIYQRSDHVQVEICTPPPMPAKRALPTTTGHNGVAAAERFVTEWRSGKAGVPFCGASARDLYAAFKVWCSTRGHTPPSQTAFGRAVATELKQRGAPPQRQLRFKAWSRHVVEAGDWTAEPQRQQGIVHFTSTSEPAHIEASIQRFQKGLHELLRKTGGKR